MKKITAIFLTALLFVSLAACGAKSAASSDQMSASVYDKVNDAESMDVSYGTSSSEGTFTMVDSALYSDPDAKIIRSMQMTIQTLDFEQSAADLAALTEQYGGYYETAQIENGGYNNQYTLRSAYYVVRIPKENFVAFRDSVGQVGHIFSAEEASQNVGEEYYDTEARLETLTTKRERLLALLDKAEVMEDIISLETALADVQYEIDLYTSTLRRYDSLIDYSTFTIDLNEVKRIDDTPAVQESFGARMLASLKSGWVGFTEGLESFALWLARNIITLVILAVIVVVAVKVIRVVRRRRRQKYDE